MPAPVRGWEAAEGLIYALDRLKASAALVAGLDPDGTGAVKIALGQADRTWAPPWVLLSLYSNAEPTRIAGANGSKVWADQAILVDCLTPGAYDLDTAKPLMDLIIAALDNSGGVAWDGRVYACRQAAGPIYLDTVDGQTVTHNQLYFTLEAQGAVLT